MKGQIPKKPYPNMRLQGVSDDPSVITPHGAPPASTPSSGTPPPEPAKKKGSLHCRDITVVVLCLIAIACFFMVVRGGGLHDTSSIITAGVMIISGLMAILGVLLHPRRVEKFFEDCEEFIRRVVGTKVTWIMLSITLLIALIGVLIWPYIPLQKTTDPSTISCAACGVALAPDGERIGISEGDDVFDTSLQDNVYKQKQDWLDAIKVNENDAEALIYQEDKAVIKQPHLTFVVVTTLTLSKGSHDNASLDLGRTILQGAFVAQREANQSNAANHADATRPPVSLPDGRKMRLLIANVGDTSTQAMPVANQILKEAQLDPNFAGVMGWPFSASEALKAIQMLADKNIPMISPTASTDWLTSTTSAPYFLRIAPTDSDQAQVGVQFAKNVLNPGRVALFTDNNNPYSKTLSEQFKEFWGFNPAITSYAYTRGDPASLQAALGRAMQKPPDLIYFAGYSDDLQVILQDPLLQSRFSTGKPFIMGGDGLSTLGGYKGTYRELYMTEFAYPDEWDILGLYNSEPAFFTDFQKDFDSQKLHLSPCDYNFCRSQGTAMLAYDAMEALLMGCKMVLKQNQSWDLSQLEPALLQIDGSTPERTLQGVTGQIHFTSSGDVNDKAVVVLCVTKGSTSGYTKLVGIYNTFQAGGPRLARHYPSEPDQIINQCST